MFMKLEVPLLKGEPCLAVDLGDCIVFSCFKKLCMVSFDKGGKSKRVIDIGCQFTFTFMLKISEYAILAATGN